jgi:serine kinase of HPr protein (carbohydrate metabolism regulator)
MVRLLDARVVFGEDMLDAEVASACASDMMSDVLAFPKEQIALLTGLNNPQVIRTADILDIRCVVFVRGKQPAPEILEMAREYGVAILSTDKTMYVASGILYVNGLREDSCP